MSSWRRRRIGADANEYDSFAAAYTAETENNLVNAYYERPAILNLAGEVRGRRILDAGCGSGPLFAALRERGAEVTGIDSSGEMVDLARQRLGAEAALQKADLRNPLPFPDGFFDDVIASLVLHYIQDWASPLAEMRRVLRPAGRIIASVDHPFHSQAQAGDGANYFATRDWSFQWNLGGHAARMTFWHRPLHAITDAFTEAGFRVGIIAEPQPQPEARDRFPDQFRRLSTAPNFLFFVLERIEG